MCYRIFTGLTVPLWLIITLSGLPLCVPAQQAVPGIAPVSEYAVLSSYWTKQQDTALAAHLIQKSRLLWNTQPDSATLLLKQALDIGQKAQFADGAALAASFLGQLYAEQKKFALAAEVLQEAIHNIKPSPYYKWKIYFTAGTAYQWQGDYQNSSKMFIAAMETAEGKTWESITRDLSVTYSNYAAVLTDMGQSDMAEVYLNKGETMLRKQHEKAGLYLLLYNKGFRLAELKQYKKALPVLAEALNLARQNKDTAIEKGCLTAMAVCYRGQDPKMLKEAIRLLEQAYRLSFPNKNTAITINTLHQLSWAYYDNGQLRLAEKYLLEALEVLHKENALYTRSGTFILGSFSELYARMGRHREAYNYLGQYYMLKDSLMGEEKQHSIQQLEIKYQVAQKDKELTRKELLIAQQEVRLGKNRIWAYVGTTSALLLSIISMLLYRNIRHRKRWDKERLTGLQKEQELEMLKISVNAEESERMRIGRELHDGVGGLLSALKMNLSVIQKQNRELEHSDVFRHVFTIADEATDELRKTAHNLVPEMLLKGGVTEAVKNFCEHIPRSGPLEIKVITYGAVKRLNSKFELSLYRILQELVNNIIKHAQASNALVQLVWQESQLNITVEDDGIGFDTTFWEQGNRAGIGLKSIKARVNTLNGNMEVESTVGSGTTIELEFTF